MRPGIAELYGSDPSTKEGRYTPLRGKYCAKLSHWVALLNQTNKFRVCYLTVMASESSSTLHFTLISNFVAHLYVSIATKRLGGCKFPFPFEMLLRDLKLFLVLNPCTLELKPIQKCMIGCLTQGWIFCSVEDVAASISFKTAQQGQSRRVASLDRLQALYPLD